MLIGYDKEGIIKFIFTDDTYLNNKFPNHSAKISNFLGNNNGLKELFIKENIPNIKDYHVVNGKLEYDKKEKIKNIPKIINHKINHTTIDTKKEMHANNTYCKFSSNGVKL